MQRAGGADRQFFCSPSFLNVPFSPRAVAVLRPHSRLRRVALHSAILAVCGCKADAPVSPQQSRPVTVAPAAITFVTPPDTSSGARRLAAGDTLGTVIIQVVNAAGSPVPAANSVVRASLQANSGGPWIGASIIGSDSVMTNEQGQARLDALVIAGTAGSTGRLVLSSGSLVAASIPIQLTVGKASGSASAVTLLPDSVPVGGVAQLVVTLLDIAGNKLGSGQTVSAALAGGSATATVSDVAFTASDSTYRASVTGSTAGTPLTLTVTANGSALAATRPLTVFTPVPPPVPASQLAISTLPGDTTGGAVVRSGSALGAIVVSLRDATGAAVLQAGVPVTATLTSASGGSLAGSTLTGGGPISTAANGTVTFPALTVTGLAGSGRVKFSAPNLAGTSVPIRITAGAISASSSTLTVAPDSVTVGGTSQITIVPKDAQGNKVGTVQGLSINATGGTALGTFGAATYQASDSSHRVTFTGTAVGTPLTVRAAAGGVTLAQTRQLRVTAGELSTTATTLTVSADTIQVGAGSTIVVTPRDAAGNKKGAGQSVTVTTTGGTSAGRLTGVSYFAADSSYRTSYIGQTAGTAQTVSATIGGAQVSTTRSITVLSAPPQTFTFCSNTGAICTFTGRRDVRLVASNGVTYTQTFYGEVPCAASGFDPGFSGAPSAPYTKCEYGEQKFEDMENVTPGMAGLTATVIKVPQGDNGLSRNYVRNGGGPSAPLGEGSFRMTCQMAKMGFFDPIVYPGAANSSHLHMFFGNTDITPNSTAASLASSGNGSCIGGTVNRTGYWVPAVFDSRTSTIITPDYATIYYKTGYNVEPSTVNEIPAGLVMIAGNKNHTSGVQNSNNQLEIAVWGCENAGRTNNGSIQSCPVGDRVTLTINFPQCWDGVNLDSPDHKSHMAYPNFRNPPQRSTCPSTHPVMLPIISEIFHWKVTAGMDMAYWRLSSDMYSTSTRGGYSAHADWMNGWTPEFFRLIVNNCLKPGKDCFVGMLGDGRELY